MHVRAVARRPAAAAAVLLALLGALEARPDGAIAAIALVAAALSIALPGRVALASPLAVAAAYLGGALAGAPVGGPGTWVVVAAASSLVVGLASAGRARPVGAVAVAVALGVIVPTSRLVLHGQANLVFGVATMVVPWALGAALRALLDANVAAALDTEQARLASARAVEERLERERQQIAAELHDLLAHVIGEARVQAVVAGERLATRPAESAASLAAVATSARAGLAETGRLLRLLRAPAEPTPAPPTLAAPRIPGLRADRAAAGLVLALGVAETLAAGLRPAPVWLAADLAGALVLASARRVPALAPGLAGAALAAPAIITDAPDVQATWLLALLLAVLAAGLRAVSWRRGLLAVGSAVAAAAVAGLARGRLPAGDAAMLAVLLVGALLAGRAIRQALLRGAEGARESARAASEARVAADARAAEGRRTLARELHDTLSGALGVIAVQAAVAAESALAAPAVARAAAEAVATTAARALEDLGPLLRMTTPEGAALAPQRGLADVRELAADAARTGMSLVVAVEADVRLAPAGDLAAFRIIQESLHNAGRHAPGAAVAVRVARTAAGVEVEVRNGAAATPPVAPRSSGLGLAGLAERVRIVDGTLDAAALADGGFRVRAILPAGGTA